MSLFVPSNADRVGRRVVGLCVIALVTACGVSPNTVEKMTESNRLDMMQGMNVQQLCRGYNNLSIGPKTEQQLLELLRDRGVEKCAERGRVRVIPPRQDSAVAAVKGESAPAARRVEDDSASQREMQRAREEAKKREEALVSEAKSKEEAGAHERESQERDGTRPADEDRVLQELFGPLSTAEIERIKTVRPADSGERLRITTAVQRSLIDPESARFGDIFVLPNKHACVAVNAKNKLGGYAGIRMAFAGTFNGTWQPLGMHDVTLEKCISMIVKLK